MKKTVLAVTGAVTIGTAAALAAAVPAAAAPARTVAVTPAHGQAIAGQYIVTVAGASPRAVAAAAHVAPRFVYDAVLHGFAGALTAGQLTALQHDPHVRSIEQDAVVHPFATPTGGMQADATQTAAPWGLDRIDQHNLPLSGSYTYNSTGAGATVYVIDTGIAFTNSEFGGRAAGAYDAFGGNGVDCNGHGTSVAAVIGATGYGVAKRVALRSVRVLDCNGSGSNSGFIAGMNWVAANHAARSVANVSMGTGYSSTVNSAATNLVNSGVVVVVAAGDNNADACNFSPGSASGTITVAATDSHDARAPFSNYGPCVDIYAPGVGIPTVSTGGPATASGTGIAAAHVSGVAALYKSTFADTGPSTVVNWIISNATPNVVTGNPAGTPNRLLYKGTL